MKKNYQYNGHTFTLKPLSLGVMKKMMPAIAKLRKLQYEYTKDIEMSEVNKTKARINELETAKNQLTGQIDTGELTQEEKHTRIYKISELETKINAAMQEIETNQTFTQKIKLYNECSALAVAELFSDEELIKPAVEVLVGAKVDINFNEPDTLKFLTQLFTDFFLLINASKMKLQN